ncbi:adenosine deaminase [Butyrivibrio sp. WCD3002]|uniref:adenosine deaminase n=1 Tax=Butyrivibrio sp. WCD3002 TaxID=1280676 RepID=UPI0004174045|nr:adenosine deaminase [Butyrivibrio sp. WCD3002]
MDFKSLPKIELHCHLDGSLDLQTTRILLAERGESYESDELADLMQVPDSCESLTEYLKRFDLPNHCLQDAEGIEESSYALAKNAAAENVKYLEVRFAPAFSTSKGMSFRDIIESVEKGLSRARSDFDIETGIILCTMRGLDEDVNKSVVKIGREMLGSGVVACDIAGDEAAYPISMYADLFKYAKEIGLPYTIHGGETGIVSNITGAIDLGAKRIGHGIAMIKDPDLMKFCGSNKIGTEICPTSNIQTKAYQRIEDCPILKFMEHGIPVSLNTDNRTVSNITCTEEYKKLDKAFGLNEDVVRRIYEDSVDMTFTSDDVKDKLLKKWTV